MAFVACDNDCAMPKFEFETNLTDPFISAYVTALFWTNEIDAVVDEIRQELNGFALLKTEFTINDLAPTTWAAIILDCADFQRLAGDLGASDPSGAGHDFWLTRAGTGAGFWDGDWTYPEGIGDVLTELSRQFGEAEMYVGDDGLIYQMGRETWGQLISVANLRRDWLPVELPTSNAANDAVTAKDDGLED